MNDITWLSHAWFGPPKGTHGPGSQGGKISNYLAIRKGRKKLNKYINSEDFTNPNWRYTEVKFKKPKPRLTEGSLVGEVMDSEKSTKKEKKKAEYINVKAEEKKKADKKEKEKKKAYESPDLDYNVSKATKKLKDENEFYEALKRNKELKMPKKDPKDYAKASGNFKGAASGIKAVSSGISDAWESLHQMKYANEDRSKKVKDLSNAELKQVIERIKLDQEYNKLTMPPKSKGYDRTMAALSALESSMNIASTGMSFIAGVQNLKRKYAD